MGLARQLDAKCSVGGKDEALLPRNVDTHTINFQDINSTVKNQFTVRQHGTKGEEG